MSLPLRDIVVAGATGLVGRDVLKILAARPDVRATALVRKAGAGLPAGVTERVFDYDDPKSYAAIGGEIACDGLLCCLGTTRGKAGSDEAFRRVDRDYPIALLDRLKTLEHKPVYGLVSSIGADKPAGLYLTTKHEVEQAVIKSGLPYLIVRPSLLVGDRQESRVGESIATVVTVPLFRVLRAVAPVDAVMRYAPIQTSQVAAVLVRHALGEPPPRAILSGPQLFEGQA